MHNDSLRSLKVHDLHLSIFKMVGNASTKHRLHPILVLQTQIPHPKELKKLVVIKSVL